MAVVGEVVSGTQQIAFLAQLPFFAGVPADELGAFTATILVRNYPAHADVVVQGQYGTSMFVLFAGAVRVHVTGDDDAEIGLAQIDKPGEFFGEGALLGRGERGATITTLTDTVLLEIEKHRFELFARRHRTVRDLLEGTYHARAIGTYLTTNRFLAALDAPSRAQLARGATLKLFQRGDTVTKRGDPATTILLVKDGVLKATRKTGTAISILAYFNTHDVVGRNDGATRDYDLEAIGQCEVIVLDRHAFTFVMASNAGVAAHFVKDDMRRPVVDMGKTVMQAAQAFLEAGVEVESLLVINLDRCVRCGNCVRACHARHTFARLDRRGPIFKRRQHVESKKHEHVMLPTSCRHCRDPECMIGCPTGAIQRHGDGDVDINDNCIGCENCARKCPYGNITMRPLAPEERPSPEVTKRAIKCNLCRGHAYSNCVHECPRGAILRVDPLRYFDELATVMDNEQKDAIEWAREEARKTNALGTKQQVRPRSTWFIPVSFAFGILAIAAVFGLALGTGAPLRGGSAVGLPLGIAAATCLFAAASLGIRKRMRDRAIGGLEAWTQFHMVLGAIGFTAALAHAGFQITGVFTTLLMIVFAIEVGTGVTGQIIYATVPAMLTRLERHGLARLVEDLYDEEATLEQTIRELLATIPPAPWQPLRARVDALAGGVRERMKATYDPQAHLEAARPKLTAALRDASLSDDNRAVILRVLESRSRLVDVRTQLALHRRLKRWLVVHVATACGLLVLLVFHIVTALTLVP